jgi:hypothetical protein
LQNGKGADGEYDVAVFGCGRGVSDDQPHLQNGRASYQQHVKATAAGDRRASAPVDRSAEGP